MTTLLLSPLGASIPSSWLSELTDRRTVDFPNKLPRIANVKIGAKNLDDTLHQLMHDESGVIDVYGHSMGAQVIEYWLRVYGPTSDIPVNRVRFYMSGNPERLPKGRGGNYPGGKGGTGHPADTPYTITDIARAGDYWANGGSFFSGMFIHMWYFGVKLESPANIVSRKGTTTNIMAP